MLYRPTSPWQALKFMNLDKNKEHTLETGKETGSKAKWLIRRS